MDSTRPIELDRLQAILGQHLPVFTVKKPHYQTVMLQTLQRLWTGRHGRLLDIGAGTGVIAQAMAELLPVGSVEAIDLVDRFCPTLTVPTRRYDGRHIPFDDGTFDAATLNNVMHHVPPAARADLMSEIRRAVAGPVYIKDHVSTGGLDNLRLWALDAWGNIPFGGMVSAQYLSAGDWERLATGAGYAIGAVAPPAGYRSGPAEVAFPNRLETTMRFDPV
jgi:SAM-dependent methyltransferase